MKKLLLLFFLAAGLVHFASLTTGCANIIPPSGGPIDSLPPQLLRAVPQDSTRNFNESRISFSFDNYVELQNIQQELLVSPVPKTNPIVEWKLNTVTVRIKDSLEENTTYSINFGNMIKDVNEGNVLRNFTYTFTTGNYFDSLQFAGKVLLAETGLVDTTLIVMLHTSGEDSAVMNSKPRYVARLDKEGNFRFRNLPPRTYHVYALQDESGTRRYLDTKQIFAFADKPVVISENTPAVTLYAYAEMPSAVTPMASASTGTTRPRQGGTQVVDRRLKFSTRLVGNKQDLLSPFEMNFEQSLKIFDTTRIGFFTDSVFTPVTDYSFTIDSTRKKVTLDYAWKQNTLYHLVLDKEFAEDTTGKKLLRTDTLSFQSKGFAEYGKLEIRWKNLDFTKNPLLLFLLNGTINQSYPLTGPMFTQPLFLPGDYELRIVYDLNKNGKWDPGEFFGVRRQPEQIEVIQRKVSIKPNWENEFEIAL